MLDSLTLLLLSALATTFAICSWVLLTGGWHRLNDGERKITRMQRNAGVFLALVSICWGMMIAAMVMNYQPSMRWILFIDWYSDCVLAGISLGAVALRQEQYRVKHFLLVGLPLLVNLVLLLVWGNSHPESLTLLGYGMYIWLLILYFVSLVQLRHWDSSLKDEYSDIVHKQTIWYRHLTLPFVMLIVVFWVPATVLPWGEWLWLLYYALCIFVTLFFTSYCLTQEEWGTESLSSAPMTEPVSPTVEAVSTPYTKDPAPNSECSIPESVTQSKENSPYWMQELERQMSVSKVYRQPNLTCEMLARLVGTNRTYLSQYLRQTEEGSFHDYINALRLEEAADLLRTTDDNIASIATSCGFSSASAFARSFREKYHTAPTDYRKQGV